MEPFSLSAYNKFRFLFFFLLLTVSIYFVNTLFISYVDSKLVDYTSPVVSETETSTLGPSQRLSLDTYNLIWKRNLFSIKVDEEEQIKFSEVDMMAQIDKLSLTSLNLSLAGTIINEAGNSLAIIKDNENNSQDKYAVGAMIKGARVAMILRNKIVLNINGKDELLVMGIEKIRAEKAAEEQSQVQNANAEVVTYKVSQDLIRNSINNVAQTLKLVRVKPYFKDGKPNGFKISRIKPGSIFKTMGFKDGDIIKGINGQQINSAGEIASLYNNLKDSKFFSIKVMRGNHIKTLNYKVM